ncbi:MAG: hypothetical protein K6E34_13975 [Lachnospiraceae bacterium]|nr:hypothetical protein [Lachnospiraceae bacterium]
MEIKRIAPETTDVLSHVSSSDRPVARTPVRIKKEKKSREHGGISFGEIPLIGPGALALLFIIALIFGITVLEMSIPVYLIILIFCTVMGVMLSQAPGFVSVFVSALLLLVGGIASRSVPELFPAVALGITMLVSSSLIIRRT